MRVAALYDVHANVRALEAVLRDIDGGVDAYVFGGDLVAGVWPRETLELARSLGDRARYISGNWERYLLERRADTTIEWLLEQLEGCEYDWPATLELDGAFYCHATPRSDQELVLPQWERSDWSSFTAPLVVCGHTHVQFDVERNGSRIVNPGSVGAPAIRATAWWAIVDDGEVELRTTDYDTAGTASAMRATGFPRDDFAGELDEPWSMERILGILDGDMHTGLYGGAFDPPHNGHVALADGAKRRFGIDRLTVLVAAQPGHRRTHSPPEVRLELARAAFPDDDVLLDPYSRTIDHLRAERYLNPLFVVGADEFCDFLSWKEPDAILELAELAVGTRPGFPRDRLETVLRQLERPDRVHFFEIEPNPASSTAIRGGGPADVPPAVAALIREKALYTDA